MVTSCSSNFFLHFLTYLTPFSTRFEDEAKLAKKPPKKELENINPIII